MVVLGQNVSWPTVLRSSIQIFQGGDAETTSKDNNLGPSQSVGVFESILRPHISVPEIEGCSSIHSFIFMSACFA